MFKLGPLDIALVFPVELTRDMALFDVLHTTCQLATHLRVCLCSREFFFPWQSSLVE